MKTAGALEAIMTLVIGVNRHWEMTSKIKKVIHVLSGLVMDLDHCRSSFVVNK